MGARACSECGTSIDHLVAHAKFCSSACKEWNRRVPCDTCGDLTWPSRTRPSPTCQPCRRARPAYRDKSLIGATETHTCATCGEEWQRKRARGQRPAHCPSCRRSFGRDFVPQKQRLAIYERDLWICGICFEPVDAALAGTDSHWRPSLDHIVPRAKGGTHEPSNLRLAHLWCNCVLSDGRKYSDADLRMSNAGAA
ncbi:MAG: HNH endonuclease [Hyphomicrobiales bacterium]|nr:MAG: HNH endonuclease [Hyphomicrobiales bacterium]